MKLCLCIDLFVHADDVINIIVNVQSLGVHNVSYNVHGPLAESSARAHAHRDAYVEESVTLPVQTKVERIRSCGLC